MTNRYGGSTLVLLLVSLLFFLFSFIRTNFFTHTHQVGVLPKSPARGNQGEVFIPPSFESVKVSVLRNAIGDPIGVIFTEVSDSGQSLWLQME